MVTERSGSLLGVLDRLGGLVDPARLTQVAEQRRVREQRFRVLVVGEAKRGKSTLINALLGRDVLPIGVVPVTAVSTTVTLGTPERLIVEYAGGVARDHPLTDLATYVTERGNPGNQLGVERVTVLLDAPLVRDGLELVDTPGAGSVYAHSAETDKALAAMDAAVFVLTSDPPVSASERDLLGRVTQASVRTFLVLNKADRLDPAELDDVTEFVVETTREVLGSVPEVFACSARQALEGRLAGRDDAGSGFAQFEATFHRYLRNDKARALQVSVSRRARGLALLALDGVRVRLRLGAMRADDAVERAAELRRRLHRIGQHGADASDLASAGVRRLLDDLNQAATRAEADLAATVVRRTRRHVDAELALLSASELGRDGRGFAVDTVRETVEAWRARQLETLERGLSDLEERLLAALAGELGELRVAARELLNLELSAEDDRSRLMGDSRFFYLLTENVGWSELVSDTIRRHLPGATARRRAVAELVTEADRLTRQQVGRVRADFQYRLQESGRALSRAIQERYAASTAAIEAAVEDAARMQRYTGAEIAGIHVDLKRREASLQGVLEDLDKAGQFARG
jgi:GTP-binding protein EngB required for normal cell division